MFLGVKGIFFAQPISDLITLVIAILLLRRSFRELDSLHQSEELKIKSSKKMIKA